MIIKINLTRPKDVSLEDMAAFVNDALSSWGGGYHPDDPLFGSFSGLMKTITVHGKVFKCEEEKNAS